MSLIEQTGAVTPYQSFNIGIIFLKRLWIFLQKKMALEESSVVDADFFNIICYEAEAYDEWAEALFYTLRENGRVLLSFDLLQELFASERTSVTYEESVEIAVESLFSILIQFVKLYCKRFNLQFLLDNLFAMRSDPHSFSQEWEIWKKVISDVTSGRKYVCSLFFWKTRERLGRFAKEDEEYEKAKDELFANRENKKTYEYNERKPVHVYLKDLPDGRQLWGLLKSENNTVLDFGINEFPQQFIRIWTGDSQHEDRAYLAAQLTGITPDQSLSAALLFLASIKNTRQERFSLKGASTISAFVSSLYEDPTLASQWKKTYEVVFGLRFQPTTVLTKAELFTMITHFCACFNYERGFEIQELIHLLYLMRYDKQNSYQKEWVLWEVSVLRALERESTFIWNN